MKERCLLLESVAKGHSDKMRDQISDGGGTFSEVRT